MIFTFWNYLPCGTLDKSIVHKWKDMNCNLFMSFRYLENKSNKQDMIDLLDEAQKVGVKVIINDERCEYLRLNKMTKEEFVKGVKESIKDFGSHPATFGFYGGDEPFSDQEENFAFTMKLLKELSPKQMHYGNLLPYWSHLLAEPDENYREDEFYYNKINKIIKEGSLDILAFDQYTQLYNESKDQKEGINLFLNGMYHFSKLAKENNIPLYVSLLSVGHYSYREPTELDIRWQINASAILGAKGIVWFYFHQTAKDYGYFNPPFLGEKAYITPIYGMIQRQQYIFQERYEEFFNKTEIDEIYHRGNVEIGQEYIPDKKKVERFDVKYKELQTLVTKAHYIDNPDKEILFIFNAEQKLSNVYSIYFADGSACHFDLMPGEIKFFDLNK